MTDITEIIVATLAFFLALIESATAESAICFALLAISFNVSYFSSSAICLYTLYGNGGLVAIIGILKSIFYHLPSTGSISQERSECMTILERTDIEDGKRIVDIFTTLSEENKNMAIVYLSALRDKEIADSYRAQKESS
jgi:hypothetical protein